MSGQVAIVGAGPSGCYVAQALLKAVPDLRVDVIDALPVPFGLVRYGVAADHQGTKGVVRQFERIFERQGARFFGNVAIGRDISLAALHEAYDAVVLAAGLSEDRRLGIPGDDVPGVHGSAALTRALHEHPDAPPLPELGAHPVIVGNGNVAIDLLRLLSKSPDELNGTDLGPGPTAWLAGNRLESITIVGRSPASRAKFDSVMIRELGKLQNVSIEVVGADSSDEPEAQKRLEALASINAHRSGPLRIVFRFGLSPLAVEGGERVSGLRVAGPLGTETIPASSILTAIGFTSSNDLGAGEVAGTSEPDETGKLGDRLYAAGWFRSGPRGAIPDSRAQAHDIAARIVSELAVDQGRKGSEVLKALPDVVDYAGWQKIDAFEIASAAPARCRQKLSMRTDLLRVAAEQEAN